MSAVDFLLALTVRFDCFIWTSAVTRVPQGSAASGEVRHRRKTGR